MPQTAAFLEKILESREGWQKRKIIWAIRELQSKEETVTPHKILQKASISLGYLKMFSEYIEERNV